MVTYDLIVLGGGPGGFTAANRAAERGLNTAIFECSKLGGVCLNEGCIPSKSFIHSTKKSSYSVTPSENKSDYAADISEWIKDKNAAVEQLRNGVRGSLRKNKVKIIFSKATIMSYQNGFTTISDAEGNEYSTNNLVIAVGSEIFIPPINGVSEALDSGFALTTSTIFDCNEKFSSLVIVGGGVIGIELAYCFSKCGVKVDIIESSDKIGASIDSDATDIIEKSLIDSGVEIHKNSCVTEIKENFVLYIYNDKTQTIKCDKVLVCTGRRPRLSGYGLEKIDLVIENRGISTDLKMRTSKSGVYAIGDVNGKSMLAHTAYREAEVCVNNIADENDQMDYLSVPSVIYGMPEVACVGQSVNDVKADGGGFIKKISMLYSGRAVAEKAAKYGFCKLIFDSNEVLRGGVIVGEYASEIILALGLMISEKYTLAKMKKTVYPHPSVCEIIRETLYSKSEPIP